MKKNITTEFAAHLRNKLTVPVMRLSLASSKLTESIDEVQAMLKQSLNEIQEICSAIKGDFDQLTSGEFERKENKNHEKSD